MRLFKELGKDVQDIYSSLTALILATPVFLMIVYLAVVMLTSCGGRNSFVETTAPGLQLEPDETDNFMDISTVTGQLPRHQYVWIDTNFTHKQPHGFIPAVWFGLVSMPGRTWGCTVMLECGAIYRNLPPHAISFSQTPKEAVWTEKDAQRWDCYGNQFHAHIYNYLDALECKVRTNDKELIGEYLFSVAPVDDAFSFYPEQAKEFTFVKLKNDRLTIQPTDFTLFNEKSFTDGKMEFPKGVKRQTKIHYCE